MTTPRQALALEFRTISASIQSLLNQNEAALLIVCASRDDFLHDLGSECCAQQDAGGATEQQRHASSILHPTINCIARSKHVKVAYTPSLSHLRAYLNALAFKEKLGEVFAILNFIGLHVSTSEYSAQGISRTLTLVVEAAASCDMKLYILESESTNQDAEREQGERHHSIWTDRVPILNGSVRSAGDERAWAGRTVELGAVLGKWCKVLVESGSV